MTKLEMADILDKAADRVRQGWCQGRLYDSKGGVCARGAVLEILGESPFNPIDLPIWDEASRFLGLTPADDPYFKKWVCTGAIIRWNNEANQTADNVAAGLNYCALMLRVEHEYQTAPEGTQVPIPVTV